MSLRLLVFTASTAIAAYAGACAAVFWRAEH